MLFTLTAVLFSLRKVYFMKNTGKFKINNKKKNEDVYISGIQLNFFAATLLVTSVRFKGFLLNKTNTHWMKSIQMVPLTCVHVYS